MVLETAAAATVFDDLRTFLAACQEADDWRQIDGADWDLEIGALTEAAADLLPSPPRSARVRCSRTCSRATTWTSGASPRRASMPGTAAATSAPATPSSSAT